MKYLVSLFIISLIAISCQKKPLTLEGYEGSYLAESNAESEMMSDVETSQNTPSPSGSEPNNNPATDKKKIIRDGHLSMKVKDLNQAKNKVDSLINKFGAYYASETLNNTEWESVFNLTIRIPASNFEPFITGVEKGEGEIQNKNIFARDVTEEFLDLETRLGNKRNYLLRYKELVKQAKTIKEILDIEERIRNLEEELESTEGRLKFLSDKVSYSTLNLTLTKPKDYKFTPAKRDKFLERFRQAFSKGWFGFVDFFLVLVNLWPFFIIALAGIFVWKKLKNKKTRKKDK